MMLFMTCRDTGAVTKAAFCHQEMFGRFVNPRRQSVGLANWSAWVGDNGAFTGFDQDVFMRCIKKLLRYKATCRCLTVPDVPFCWEPTLAKFRDWSPSIRRMGFPVGLAVQDGATVDNIPWTEIDALFIGGSTEWKRQQAYRGWVKAREKQIPVEALPLFTGAVLTVERSTAVSEIVAEAKRRGLWVHVGRSANSPEQLWYAYQLGADSVDGTRETKAPDREFRWITQSMCDIHQFKSKVA